MLVTINLAPKGTAPKKVREPLVEVPKRKNEMPDAVKVAIVRAGCFRVAYGEHTDKARRKLPGQIMEILGKSTDGEILGLLRKGYLEIPIKKWKTEEICRIAIRALAGALGKEANRLTEDDFRGNGLAGLMCHYNNSRCKAIRGAGFEVNAWENGHVTKGFWEERENRIAALKWLAEKLGKKICKMAPEDYRDNGLGGLLRYYYQNHSHEAMKDAELMKETPSPPSEGVQN